MSETLCTAEPQHEARAAAEQRVVPRVETVLEPLTELPRSHDLVDTVQTRVVKATSRAGNDWVVDVVPGDKDKDGTPTCYRKNMAPWTMPTSLTFPWIEDGTRSYVDKASGLTRNLHWDDIVADRLAVSSNPSQTKPLQLVCLGIGDALRLSASEGFRSKKG